MGEVRLAHRDIRVRVNVTATTRRLAASSERHRQDEEEGNYEDDRLLHSYVRFLSLQLLGVGETIAPATPVNEPSTRPHCRQLSPDADASIGQPILMEL